MVTYLDDEYISKCVEDYRGKTMLPNGIQIPQFINYRTVYEFDKLQNLGVCNLSNFDSVRLQSVRFGFFSISCLLEDEYRFLLINRNALFKFYDIKR